MGLGFARHGFATMGLGFARCGCFFFFGGGFCSQSCSSMVVVLAIGCGQGLWSQ